MEQSPSPQATDCKFTLAALAKAGVEGRGSVVLVGERLPCLVHVGNHILSPEGPVARQVHGMEADKSLAKSHQLTVGTAEE